MSKSRETVEISQQVDITTADQVKFVDYGAGTFVATPAYTLGVDASGQLVEFVSSSGAAQGAGGDEIFFENDTNVTTNYTITSGKNAMTAGPITIDSGITVTIPSGSNWTIV